MKSDIIIRCAGEKDIHEQVERFGLIMLWGNVADFEISSSACVTLAELRERWPSMTNEFLAKHVSSSSRILPIAGLLNIFEEDATYQCKPAFNYFEYLTISKEHPDYAARYPRSFQCFADTNGIKDFVFPLEHVERYEKEHPENSPQDTD